MKKLLLVALAAIGGLLVYRQIQADRAEQDLWTEATDSVPAGSGVWTPTHSTFRTDPGCPWRPGFRASGAGVAGWPDVVAGP